MPPVPTTSYHGGLLIYREAEMDEVWRILDLAITDPRTHSADLPMLEKIREVIMQVHDLIGVDEDVAAAAERLRTLL
jgi:hypothetical protein